MLRVIVSFENETKRNVTMHNFQLNETGEKTKTTKQRVFSTFKSLFSSKGGGGFQRNSITSKFCVIEE
jgi:hypothetical protein